MQVAKARKAADVPYPQMTASGSSEADKRFNCTQVGRIIETSSDIMHTSASHVVPRTAICRQILDEGSPMSSAACAPEHLGKSANILGVAAAHRSGTFKFARSLMQHTLKTPVVRGLRALLFVNRNFCPECGLDAQK